MPNDNKQQPVTAPPIIFTEDALPPMPQENSGSAAPADDIVMPVITTSTTPKKKFAGGKVIATILGLFLLVGGIGAGVFLVGQNQNINEKAGCYSTCMNQVGDADECDFACSKPKTEKSVNVEKPANKWKDDCACGVNAAGTACKSCVQEQQQPKWKDDCACGVNAAGTACKSCVQTPPYSSCSECRQDASYQTCVDLGACTSSSTCASPSLMVNGVCVPYGNCQSNTGNCYVKTKIGVGEGDKQVCDGSHWTTCAEGYVCSNEDCVPSGTKTQNSSISNPSNNETTPTTTTTTTPTAQCQNIKAYSPAWALLTNAQLSVLTTGSQVNFCVAGVASAETFDKARLTINGVLQAETSTIRPGSTDFCQLYVIPAGTTTFNVTAQIHHVTLGWK